MSESRRERREAERTAGRNGLPTDTAKSGLTEAGESAAPAAPAPAVPDGSVPPEAPTQDVDLEQQPVVAAAASTAPEAETAESTGLARGRKTKPANRKVLGFVGSAAVLCLGAAVIAGGSIFAAEFPAQGAATEVTTLPAGDSLATCPASVRLLKGAGAELDPEFAPASKDSKSLIRAAALSDSAGRIPGAHLLKLDGSQLRELAPRLDEADAATLAGAAADGFSQRKGVVAGGISEAEALTLRTQPLGGLQSLSGAARFYSAKDGDLAGLSAAGCSAPAAESWITGATTTAGSTAILHLTNPSASVTQVDIDLRGSEGRIETPNLDAIAIAPGEAKSFVLAAYAPNEKSLALKIVASGGKINAIIQQSTLRGLVPGGVDYLVAGTPAANQQVIPGLVLQDPVLAGELAKPAANADAIAELHVAATSSEGATVKVKALGANGEVAIPGGGELVVSSNSTARLPLTGMPAGNYTLVLESDSAISAGAKMVRGTKANEAMDMAWAASASRIGNEHLVPLPEFGSARLVLNAPADEASITLRPLGKDGKLGAEKKIELAGSRTVVVKAGDLGSDVAAIVMSASGAPAYAATLVEDGAVGIAAVPLGASPVGRTGVQVQLRH